MPFLKGEVISCNFQMPHNGNEWLPHSAVILSCPEVYNKDKLYVCAMMSSNGVEDRFSFPINNNDLERPSNKANSQVRCHLITYVLEEDIQHSDPYNKFLDKTFERLIYKINDSVFDV